MTTGGKSRGWFGRRLRGFVGIAGRYVLRELRRPGPGHVRTSVIAVAVAIVLLLVVSSVAVGLVAGTTGYSDDIDYWIVPEGAGDTTALVATGGPQFGDVHAATDRITDHPDVTYATPVLANLHRLNTPGGEAQFILVVGVIPTETAPTILGMPVAPLAPADGYDPDAWTGRMVLTQGAADLLGATTGDTVHVADAPTNGDRAFDVVFVEGEADGAAGLPVAVVALADAQALTGATDPDAADQFLVAATSPAVVPHLEAVYPQSTVETRSGLLARELLDAELPLALAVTALLVTAGISVVFVGTAMGLEVTTHRPTYRVLSAIGVSSRSQFVLIATQTLAVTTLAGLLGGLAGYLTTHLINHATTHTDLVGVVAFTHPGLIIYGLLVGVVIGLVLIPYLAILYAALDTRGSLLP